MSKPYFDVLPEKFVADPEALEAFGSHIHWGYWEDPRSANGTLGDFQVAAENLSRQMCEAATIQDGMNVLDAGCGFGGTIAHINSRFSQMALVGVNIDQEQLNRAQEIVIARPENQIQFVHADACKLPFPDGSFDAVLAVECIFAFPSRMEFFREAHRVLRPGGQLTLCDFLPSEWLGKTWQTTEDWTHRLVGQTFGRFSVRFCTHSAYDQLAKSTGFSPASFKDITPNTLPTYPVVNRLMQKDGDRNTYRATKGLQILSHLHLLRYVILSYKAD